MVSTDQQNKIFDKAAKLIQNGWCQHAGALDAQGDRTHRLHVSAVCFCLTAALELATLRELYPTWRFTDPLPEITSHYWHLLKHVADILGIKTEPYFLLGEVASWNDDTCRTKEDVLNLLKEAKYV